MTRWMLGVDLGTSFSAGALATDDGVELLEINGERRIPSTVLLTDDDQLLAGTFAQRSVGRMPERAERNPKRYVGRGPMLLGGKPVTAVQALSALLTLFVTEARRRFDDEAPTRLVLTHPVAWSGEQQAVLRGAAAAVLPGTQTLLVAEPVAAAWHYAHDHALRDGDSVAVYDLGGGTFDTAVLVADAGSFRVVGQPGGDPEIGGESFDQQVFGHFGAQLAVHAPDWWQEVSTSPERRWQAAAADLLREARMAKESLSDYPSASQYVPGADVDVRIDRGELEALIGDDVRRTGALLAETIAGAAVAPSALRGIFLTGGASRTPMVQQSLRATYDALVRTWQDPKTVVALGAARWAREAGGGGAATSVSGRGSGPGARPATGAPASTTAPGPTSSAAGTRPPGTAPPLGTPPPATMPPATTPRATTPPVTTPASATPASATPGSTTPGSTTPGSGTAGPGSTGPGSTGPGTAGPGNAGSGSAGSSSVGSSSVGSSSAGRGGAGSSTSAPGPRSATPHGLEPLADGIRDARIAGGALYTLSTDHHGGVDVLCRVDARTGRVDRRLALGRMVAWAVSDNGVLVAERRGDVVHLHALAPELTIRSSRSYPSRHDPHLVLSGDHGWAYFRSSGTRQVDNSTGLAWGEIGELMAVPVRLSSTFVPDKVAVSVGAAAFWYVNEDGVQRRLLDPSAPTTTLPGAAADGSVCGVVMGRVTRPKRAIGRLLPARGPSSEVVAWQVVGTLGHGGGFQAIAEQRSARPGSPWVQQVLWTTHRKSFHLATNIGLETFGNVSSSQDRRLVLTRPRTGAVRWIAAGSRMYGVAMEQILPNRGFSVHVLDGDGRVDLGQWAGLLGNLMSVRADETPRIVVDGEALWIGADDGTGGSLLLRADPARAQVVAAAPGWLEPVGRLGDAAYALHAPGTPPGDGRAAPGQLVRITS